MYDYICTGCDVPIHRKTGTNADNQSDMVHKGRSAKGEQHSQAKLTTKDVCQIRILAKEGKSQSYIAGRFDIDQSHVSNIVNRKTWKHI